MKKRLASGRPGAYLASWEIESGNGACFIPVQARLAWICLYGPDRDENITGIKTRGLSPQAGEILGEGTPWMGAAKSTKSTITLDQK